MDLKDRKVKQFKVFLVPEDKQKPLNALAEYVPVEKIVNGIIYTRDHRYVKVVEVIPVNFLLRSAQEQRSIIYSFISYLKIAPVKLQFKVLTKRADIDRHVETVRKELERETDPHCRMLQEDYLKLIRQLGSREAIPCPRMSIRETLKSRHSHMTAFIIPGPIPRRKKCLSS